jgi:SAM-dependent methyltransferase
MNFEGYLDAKASIERRCLNATVLNEVKELVGSRSDPSVLEVGAGTGSMPIHLSENDVLPEGTRYVALDEDVGVLDRGRERLSGHPLSDRKTEKGVRLGGTVVEFTEGDLYDTEGDYDLVVAHAVLDLLRLDEAVEHLLSLADLFYFPVSFDGVTAFEPRYDEELDGRIEEAYHGRMDEREGSSETGRRVFGAVRKAGGTVTSAGASDWVVFPGEDGYTEDEEYLLRYIVETVREAVSGRGDIEESRLREWAKDRRALIDDEELVYIAHQLDIAGRAD